MTTTRVALTTAGIVSGVLLMQATVIGLWSLVFGYASFGGSLVGLLDSNLFWTVLTTLLHCLAFGVGVYLVVRYFAPVLAEASWRRTVARGVLATVGGGLAALIVELFVSLVAAITIGAYPFGYSLDAVLDPSRVQFGFQNTVVSAITPFIEWLPLVVLACVFLKLWLMAHPSATSAWETTDRASASA